MLITCGFARKVCSVLNLENPCGLSKLEGETWKLRVEFSFVMEIFEIKE